MTAPKDTIYPDMLKIRDTGIYEDSGRRIHTTAGMGYPRKEYVRADLVEELEAENQRLREALRPFGDAADHAIEAVSKTTTLGVLGSLAPYFVSWQDFKRARAVLHSTEEDIK